MGISTYINYINGNFHSYVSHYQRVGKIFINDESFEVAAVARFSDLKSALKMPGGQRAIREVEDLAWHRN